MKDNNVIEWLLEGDVSIQYQTHRDLLGKSQPQLQRRIKSEGWGRAFLSKRREDGHWGLKFYQPKWTSTHYTLLDLKNLSIEQDVPEIRQTIGIVLKTEKGPDGGIRPIGELKKSDVCINGMFLNYAAYFRMEVADLESIVDFLLSQYMPDGGYNCNSNRIGCVHSSLHTTLSVLEGILEYQQNGYHYRLGKLLHTAETSREFILMHHLFKSDKTGKVIDEKMTRLSYPCRWKYDILRALDYFQKAAVEYDSRMDDALQILHAKKRSDGKWPLQSKHPGAFHFEMEKAGQPSRWNTLRALRVLKWFGIDA